MSGTKLTGKEAEGLSSRSDAGDQFEKWWKQFWISSPRVSPSEQAREAALAGFRYGQSLAATVSEQQPRKVTIAPAIWDGTIRIDSDCIINGVEVKAGTTLRLGDQLPAERSEG